MVSQRQKLARKRYKDANPELFPPPPPPDPNKKKKKTSSFKRKKSDPNNSSNVRKSSFKKHPLRVAGMKPGESCYICKAPDHIAKNCPQKSEWERNKICLSCRQRGHSLKNCPNKNEESTDMKLCYNCGEMGHSLSRCPQPLQDGMCSGIWKRRRWITDTEKCTQFLWWICGDSSRNLESSWNTCRLKKHMKDWVLAEPDTKVINLTTDMEYLVLASDALWGERGKKSYKFEPSFFW